MSSARAAKIRDSHFCRAGYRTQIALAPPRRPKAYSRFSALQTLPLRPRSVIPALRHGYLAELRTEPAPPSPIHPSPYAREIPQFIPPPSQGRFPNSSLPPSRGEVRWGVGVPSRRHRPRPAPITHAIPPPSPLLPLRYPYSPPSFLHPLRHSCAGRNPRGVRRLPWPRTSGDAEAAWPSRQDVAARASTGDRRDSCLCRNDGSLNSP